MNRRRTCTLLLVAFLSTACTGFALGQKSAAATDQSIDNLLGDHIKFQHLMTALQQDVAAHNAAGVATLIRYPFTSSINGKEITMKIPSDFIQNYDSIVTPSVAEVVKNQRYEDLMINFKGAMFGNGELWIAAICREKSCTQSDLRVVTIQDPEGTGKKKKKWPL